MSKYHKDSEECALVNLDLTSPPKSCGDIRDVFYTEISTINSVTDGCNTPVEFHIPATPQYYIDLSHTLLHLQIQLVKQDGSVLNEEHKAAPINCIAQTMFQQVDIYLNDKLVTASTNMYPYRAMIETLLNYGQGAKSTWLTNSLFIHDTAEGIADTLASDKGTNVGLFTRWMVMKHSKVTDLLCKPHADLFMQNRPIIPNVDIRIRMTRSSPEFTIMADESDPNSYMIKIVSAKLIVRYIEPSTDIIIAHNKALEKGNTCKYPLHRCLVTTYCIPKGVMSHSRSIAIVGQLPVRIIIGIVRNDAYNGKYSLNPFVFNHYHLSYLQIVINGRALTANPLTPDFDAASGSEQFARAYNTIFSGTDSLFQNFGNSISKKDYKQGYTLYAFKLSEDFGDDYFGMKKEGNVQIDIRFSKPTEHTFNVILYQEYLNILDIDKNRFVTFDYNA
jgi:hypothetical protein